MIGSVLAAPWLPREPRDFPAATPSAGRVRATPLPVRLPAVTRTGALQPPDTTAFVPKKEPRSQNVDGGRDLFLWRNCDAANVLVRQRRTLAACTAAR
ncbi:hypothetical protein MTO96_049905 [Rhipicephalus appendiculatus]